MNYLNLLFLLVFPFHVSGITNPKAKSDTGRMSQKIRKHFPVESRRDYRIFSKQFSRNAEMKALIDGADSMTVQFVFGPGTVMSRELFDLTFALAEDSFHFALLYQNSFSRFRLKDEEWYLAQFAVVFNASGKAFKILDHQARGYTLYDKRKRKSV